MRYVIFEAAPVSADIAQWNIFDDMSYHSAEKILIKPSVKFVDEANFDLSICCEQSEVKYFKNNAKVKKIYVLGKEFVGEDDVCVRLDDVDGVNNIGNVVLKLVRYLSYLSTTKAIILHKFDFLESAEYLVHSARDDISDLRKILDYYEGQLVAPSSKFFNLIVEYFRLHRESKYEVVDISSCNLEQLYFDFQKSVEHVKGEKCITTITSAGYEWGTITLCQSVRKYHDDPVIILYTENTDIRLIQKNVGSHVYLVKVPVIHIEDGSGIDKRYFNTLNKFYVLALSQFKRVVYLDSDMLVLGDLKLFLNGNQNLLTTLTQDKSYRQKVMAVCILSFKASKELFIDFLENAIKFGNKGRGDHPYFIDYYRDNWECATDDYNISHVPFVKTGIDINHTVRAIHYHGFKPWDNVNGRGSYFADSNIHKLWFEALSHRSLVEYIMWGRTRQLKSESRNIYNKYMRLIQEAGAK